MRVAHQPNQHQAWHSLISILSQRRVYTNTTIYHQYSSHSILYCLYMKLHSYLLPPLRTENVTLYILVYKKLRYTLPHLLIQALSVASQSQ